MPHVRGCVCGRVDRGGASRDDPDRKLDCRPGRRHPPSDAGIAVSISSASTSCGSIISCSAVPGARLDDSRRWQPCPCARPMPQRDSPSSGCAPSSPPTRRARRANSRRASDRHRAVIATTLAAEIYGLEVLRRISRTRSTTPRASSSSRPSREDAEPEERRSSPPSSSGCATCRRRSTRRWAASPPMA